MVAPGWQEYTGIMHSGETGSLLIAKNGCQARARSGLAQAVTNRKQFVSGRQPVATVAKKTADSSVIAHMIGAGF